MDDSVKSQQLLISYAMQKGGWRNMPLPNEWVQISHNNTLLYVNYAGRTILEIHPYKILCLGNEKEKKMVKRTIADQFDPKKKHQSYISCWATCPFPQRGWLKLYHLTKNQLVYYNAMTNTLTAKHPCRIIKKRTTSVTAADSSINTGGNKSKSKKRVTFHGTDSDHKQDESKQASNVPLRPAAINMDQFMENDSMSTANGKKYGKSHSRHKSDRAHKAKRSSRGGQRDRARHVDESNRPNLRNSSKSSSSSSKASNRSHSRTPPPRSTPIKMPALRPKLPKIKHKRGQSTLDSSGGSQQRTRSQTIGRNGSLKRYDLSTNSSKTTKTKSKSTMIGKNPNKKQKQKQKKQSAKSRAKHPKERSKTNTFDSPTSPSSNSNVNAKASKPSSKRASTGNSSILKKHQADFKRFVAQTVETKTSKSNKKDKDKDKEKEREKLKRRRKRQSEKIKSKRSQKSPPNSNKVPAPISIDRESDALPPSQPVLSPTSFSHHGHQDEEYQQFSSDKRKNSPMSPSEKTKKLIEKNNRKYAAKERGTNDTANASRRGRNRKKVKFQIKPLETETNTNTNSNSSSRSSSQRREKSKTPKHNKKKSKPADSDGFVRRRSESNKFLAGNKMDGTPRTPQENEQDAETALASIEHDEAVVDYNEEIKVMLKRQEVQSKQHYNNSMSWGKAKTANQSLPAFPSSLTKSLYLYHAARSNNVLFPVQSGTNPLQTKQKRPKSPNNAKNDSNKRSKRSTPISRMRRNSDSSTGSDDSNGQRKRVLHRGRFTKHTSPNKRRRNAVGVSDSARIQSQLLANYAGNEPSDSAPTAASDAPAFVFVDSEYSASTKKQRKLSATSTTSTESSGPRRRPQRSRARTTTSVPIELPSVIQVPSSQKRDSASSPSTPKFLTQSHSDIKDGDKAIAKIAEQPSNSKHPSLSAAKSDPTSSPSPSASSSASASPLVSPLIQSSNARQQHMAAEDSDSGSDLELEQDSKFDVMNNSEIKSNIFHNSNSDEELNDKSPLNVTANTSMAQKSAPMINAQYMSPRGKTSNLFDSIAEKAASAPKYPQILARRSRSGKDLHSNSRRKAERASSVSSTTSVSSSVSTASSVSERDDKETGSDMIRRRGRNRRKVSLSGSISSDEDMSDESSISSVSDDSSSYSSDESDSRSVSSTDSRSSSLSRTSSRSSISSRSSRSKTPRSKTPKTPKTTSNRRSRAASTTPATRYTESKSAGKIDSGLAGSSGTSMNSLHDSLYSKMADMMMMMSQHNYTQSMSSNSSAPMFSPRKLQSIQIGNADSFVFMNMNGILSPPATTPKNHPVHLDESNADWDQFSLDTTMQSDKKSNSSNNGPQQQQQQYNPQQFDVLMQSFMSSYNTNSNTTNSLTLNSSFDSFGQFSGDSLTSPLNMKPNANGIAPAAAGQPGIDINTTSLLHGQTQIDHDNKDEDLDAYQQRMAKIMLQNSFAEDTSCSASDNELDESPMPV